MSSGFNVEDSDIAHAEHQANPEYFSRSYAADAGLEREYTQLHPDQQQQQQQQQGSGQEEVEQLTPLPDDDEDGSSVSTRRRQAPHRTSTLQAISTATSRRSSNYRYEEEFMEYLDRHPTAIRRIEDHRLQHSLTVGSRKDVSASELPSFGGGKPYPPPLPDREEYIVEFDSFDDPRHPQNFKTSKKLLIGAILAFDSLAATFASSIFSAGSTYIGQDFGVGQEVTTLGTSLFVLGYAVGPMVFAPMSELYGRRLPIIIGAFGFGVFNIGVAVAKDYQTLMICRFFAGTFGSCPLTVVGAVFADMFNNEYRGIAVAIFSATVTAGPFTGPFVGGFISKSYLGWRWTAYIPSFMGFTSCVLALIFQEETYGPVILVSKASELRRLTRNWGIHAKQEEVEVDFKELVVKNISRPLRILFTEPIVLLVTIYMSFIYGLLYLSLTSYAIIFGELYGFSPGVSGLPYIAMIVGVIIGIAVVVYMNGNYVRKLKDNNNIPVPEWRLPICMVGGISFACGLFWLGWGGHQGPQVHWIVPTLAGLLLGFGIYTVFLQCLNYIIDAYLMFAASAIAANTFMRSLCGAIFPLFATYMFQGMGVQWALTFLGLLAFCFAPLPFFFYYKGKTIRAKSKFAPAPDIQQDRKRDEESGGAQRDEREKDDTSDSNGLNGASNDDSKKAA